ncbi:MAG: hypothetical protein DRQ40_10810 [Gammaproteobacteria bacterium]|nr:MAG: hypothetical protein DRQ40_10810 [Gammaproteobacteria bacterium]
MAGDAGWVPNLQQHQLLHQAHPGHQQMAPLPLDHERRDEVLRGRNPAHLRGRLRARPGHQEDQAEPRGEGGHEAGHRLAVASGGRAGAIRGLQQGEHVVHRASEPDHPARLGVPQPTLALPCTPEEDTGEPPGAVAWPLQLLPPAQRPPIRERGSDTRDAGRLGDQEAVAAGHLHCPDRACTLFRCAIRASGVSGEEGDHEMSRVVTTDDG